MTMISCAECGGSVSNSAKSCPSCGTSGKRMRKAPKAPTPFWNKALIVTGLAAVIVVALMLNAEPPPTPEQVAAEAASTSRNTAALRAAQTLKDNLRDPSSARFEYVGVNEDGSTVCIRYRARNGFGGINLDQLVFVDGTPRSSRAEWRKRCANAELYDVTGVKSLVR